MCPPRIHSFSHSSIYNTPFPSIPFFLPLTPSSYLCTSLCFPIFFSLAFPPSISSFLPLLSHPPPPQLPILPFPNFLFSPSPTPYPTLLIFPTQPLTPQTYPPTYLPHEPPQQPQRRRGLTFEILIPKILEVTIIFHLERGESWQRFSSGRQLATLPSGAGMAGRSSVQSYFRWSYLLFYIFLTCIYFTYWFSYRSTIFKEENTLTSRYVYI